MNKQIFKAVALLVGAGMLAAPALAQNSKGSGASFLLSDGGQNSVQSAAGTPAGVAGTGACFDMTGAQSWDLEGDADNIVVDIPIGSGNAMTAVAWDVGLTTVGSSWLSEARVKWTSTGDTTTGLFLTVGIGDDTTGDSEYSSMGFIDLTDNGIPDVMPDADGILRLEFFESFDDNSDAVDADWRNAASPAVCPGISILCTDQNACNSAVALVQGQLAQSVPADAPWAIALLIMLLGGIGFVMVRRFA
ncbi:MAG: hypothetical protein R3323_03555 [Wenzhouxiangellaceae bacterium]|nr:hypothetical protein [Wenzhouxiangellaceae bacterium]